MNRNIDNANCTLAELLKTVQDQAARTADFVVATNQAQIETTVIDGGPNQTAIILERDKGMPTTFLRANDTALDQIATRTGVLNVQTARILRESYPAVYDHAIREIWDDKPEQRLIRAHLDASDFGASNHGVARAVVSNKFKTFDNVHLLEAALPQLLDSDAQWTVTKGQVTDKRMYLQLKSDVITADARDRAENMVVNSHAGNGTGRFGQRTWESTGANPNQVATKTIGGVHRAVGDIMALAISFTNSEVGHGSIGVAQMVCTLDCLNMLQTENQHRSAHLTSARGDEDFAKILKADTIAADNNAMALKLRDLVASYSSPESFEATVDRMAAAHLNLIEVEPQQAVENLGAVLKLTKPERSNLLDGLLSTLGQAGYQDGRVTQAALVNATTAVAHKVHPDHANDWSKRGAKVLNLDPSQWETVATKRAA